MVSREQIEWLKEIVRQEFMEGEFGQNHTFAFFIEDPDIGLSHVSFRVDRRGRVYLVEEDSTRLGLDSLLMGGRVPKYSSRYYFYGYARAVAEEYEVLTVDLLTSPQAWHEEARRLASGLEIPDGPERSYSRWISHCQKVLKLAQESRPEFVEFLKPIAERHGLDVVPWGMASLIKGFVPVVEAYTGEDEPDERPVRGQRRPRIDALLLYIYLAGYLNDPKVKEMISMIPDFDLDYLSDPVRKVQKIKNDLGISRRSGRPPNRSMQDPERDRQVYDLVERQIRYMIRVA